MKQSLVDFLEVFQDVNKTAIMLFLLAVGALFRVKGYISGEGLVTLLQTTTVSYFGTTTFSHLTEVVKDHLATKLETLHAQSTDSKDSASGS